MISPRAAAERFAIAAQYRREQLHVLAAVNPPHGAGDVRGLVGGEEVNDASDLIWPTEPSERDLGLDPLEHLLGDVLEHLGRDEPGGDRVDGHAERVLCQLAGPLELEGRLARQRLREAEEAGLRGSIV